VFFLDDPWGNRVRPNEVINSLQNVAFPWLLVLGMRKTDTLLAFIDVPIDAGETRPKIEIPAEFSPSELDRLPNYLVLLHAASNLADAKAKMPAPGMKQSRDVLCSLWYLLPQTQASLEESLIGEYHRLGEIDKAVAAFASAV